MTGESSSKPEATKDAGGSSSKPKATKDDAYAYLRAVKDAFPNDRDKYDDFITIMNNFKARRIDRDGCIKEVKELIKGHRDLISGFNAFLPEYLEIADWYNLEVQELMKDHQNLHLGFSDILHPEDKRVTNPEDPEAKRIIPLDDFKGLSQFQTMVSREVPREPTINHSRSYITSVKEAFRDEHGKYVEFHKILNDYYANRLDRTSAIARLKALVKGHQELILGFDLFFPVFPDDEAKRIIPPESSRTNLAEAKRTIPPEPSRTNLAEAKRTVPPEDRDHHGVESNCTKRKHVESDGDSFMDKLKTRFRTLDTHVVGSFREIMENFEEGKMSKKEVCDEVVDLLYYHEDLIEDFPRYFKQRKTYRNSINNSY